MCRARVAETAMDRGIYLEGLGYIGWAAIMTAPEVSYTYSRLGSHSMFPLEDPHYSPHPPLRNQRF